MATLDAKTRARLPDSAFAYIDSRGRRRLPINDESHVRNALSRFNQTAFEDEAARERALTRLLRAAKKYGIVPVGFMTGQLNWQKAQVASGGAAALPSGLVTLLLADIEDSTGLVRQLGDRYADLLADARRMLRSAIRSSGGREVDARADELFAVFERAQGGLEAALAIQRKALGHAWKDGHQVRFRVGLHTGSPTLTSSGYVGLPVNTAARICFAGHGGQIVLSEATRKELEELELGEVGFKHLGNVALQGLPAPEALFQVLVGDLPADFPPPRSSPVPSAV